MIALPDEDGFVELFRQVARAAGRERRAHEGRALSASASSAHAALGLDSVTLDRDPRRPRCLEERLGVSFTDERIADLRTIADVRAALRHGSGGGGGAVSAMIVGPPVEDRAVIGGQPAATGWPSDPSSTRLRRHGTDQGTQARRHP